MKFSWKPTQILLLHSEDAHRAGYIFSESDLDLSFQKKAGFDMYGMVYIECKIHVCK